MHSMNKRIVIFVIVAAAAGFTAGRLTAPKAPTITLPSTLPSYPALPGMPGYSAENDPVAIRNKAFFDAQAAKIKAEQDCNGKLLEMWESQSRK